MKTGRKIFWGLLFVLGALALIVGQMGYLGELSFWTILLSIGLAGLFLDGLFTKNYVTIFFSAAFFVIVNDTWLGLEAITPWPVLGAALLLTIGLSILFPGKGKWQKYCGAHHHWDGHKSDISTDSLDGENVRYETCFGEAVKYITSQELSYADLECSFGSLVIYFDNAVLKEHTANVHVECSFGSTVLYIPSDWKVVHNTKNAFGGTDEKGHCNPNGENVLYINGDISFGALEIRYL